MAATTARPAKTTKGHKCLGARISYHVSCECGWASMDFDASCFPNPRAEAYKAWREHVATVHSTEGR
jgi:hypothetical protein